MPLIDGFYDAKDIKLIVNSNEFCVGSSSIGYSKSSNQVGVAVVTGGCGLTNLITSMLDATNDSTPLVVFSGQVPISTIGTNAFQEAPSVELSKHVTKWSYQIKDINEMSYIIDEAFEVARDGKPGSVHIDIPKCVSYQELYMDDVNYHIRKAELKQYIPTLTTEKTNHYIKEEDEFDYKKIATLIENAKKPILYIGQGCKTAVKELQELATISHIPVTSTIHGVGIFNEKHYLSLRFCGMHGNAVANIALQEADLIIAIGSRFDDRTTGAIDTYAPEAKKASKTGQGGIIHCNINTDELDFVVESNYNFCMDSKVFLDNLLPYIKVKERNEWLDYLFELSEKYPFHIKRDTTKLHMEDVLDKIGKLTMDEDVTFTTGVGNHQMQAYQFIKSQYPGKIISSGSLGVMGVGLPYAIGVQLANPDKMVICIDGDSSFNMTLCDLKTIAEYNLPVKILIMNNNAQMMVTIWEKLFFEERYTATLNEKNPDYVALAASYGIHGIKCDDASDLLYKLCYFINYDEGPILMECSIERDICLPLVKPGCALDDMILPGEENFSDIATNNSLPPS
jgi:acetolactate synthase-1/2/3 large subunit